MVDPEVKMNVSEGDTDDIVIDWMPHATLLVDSIVGFVTVNGVSRITLGSISYRPNGEHPKYQPVVTVAIGLEQLRFMATQFAEIAASGSGVAPDPADSTAHG